MLPSIKSSCRVATTVLAVTACILSLSFLSPAQAHSTTSPTITRTEHIFDVHHEILPKDYVGSSPLPSLSKRSDTSSSISTVTKHDTLRIQFVAYNTTFHLHLEPNLDLIHPDLDLSDDNSGFSLDEIMAFKGFVVEDEYFSDHKWNQAARTTWAQKRSIEHHLAEDGVLGWARMLIEHDPKNNNALVMRGAFMANGETYQVTTQEHYHLQKRSDDAAPPPLSSSTPLSSAGSGLVIFRDSDLYTRSSNILRRKRGLAPEGDSSCGSEILFDRSRRAEAEAEAGVVGAEPKPLIHEYYYPPNLTTYIPDLSSSWSDVWKTGSLRKRDVAINVAGPNPVPDGCPTSRLVNYMGVAADCTYVRNYKGSANARKQIFSTFNTVSAIYESTFNVALGIIALNIVPDGCPSTPVEDAKWNQDCSDSYSIDLRLSDFSNWRGQGDRSRDGAGLWHLMTTCKSGPVVGIAWTKALCQAKTQTQNTDGKQQYTAGAAVSSAGPQEWMVVAHEIGHNFGAVHDCNQQTCTADKAAGSCCPLSSSTCDAGAKYIMNPSESTPTKIFSPCSIKAICHTLKSGAGQCLKPPGTRVTHSSEPNICGNGLKEEGEECDCGSPEDCAKDPCCDGTTCKLKNGAVCDDLNDGCCLNCQMRPQGHVCRPAISECDIQEVCSGTNASCPSDERVPNLTPCKGSKNETGLQCANGLCTSRDLQCKQQDKHGKFKQCSASNTCELTCNDPSGSALSCIQVQGTYFVDGSPCGFGGTCNAGTCEYTGGVNSVLDWIKGNLLIFVPVAAIVGLFFLCCIWSCCCAGCYNRRRQQRLQGKPQRLNSTGYQYSSFAPPPGNPPGYPPPQQYPMAPMGSMVPPTPSYQGGYPQQPQPQPTGFTYHSNASSNPNNPFGNHNALPNQQRPQQSGYI